MDVAWRHTQPGPAPAPPCDEIERDLCRLAVGLSAERSMSEVVRHVGGCASCHEAVQHIAGLRTWLETSATPRLPEGLAPSDLEQAIRRALVRELSARFARDLVAVVRGRAPRAADQRRCDRERLAALAGEGTLAAEPWTFVFEVLAGRAGSSADRARMLDVAVALDPTGLDIGMTHLAELVGCGQRERAEREADRWLSVLT